MILTKFTFQCISDMKDYTHDYTIFEGLSIFFF